MSDETTESESEAGVETGDPVHDMENGADVDDYYWKLRHYVRMVARGETNALLVRAPHGIGKSYQITKTLREENREHRIRCLRRVGGHATPVELYHTLYDTRDGGVVFMDDLEGIIRDKTAVSLLKQATWSESETRRVEWRSTSEKINAPESFTFTGRLIFCFNEMPNNAAVDSLVDRTLYYEMDFDYDERIELVHEVATAEYKSLTDEERAECAEWIERHTTPGSDVNLRTLFHVMDCRSHEPDHWRRLAQEFVEADEEMVCIERLLDEHDTVEGAAEAYAEETGKSERTFFRRKSEIEGDAL